MPLIRELRKSAPRIHPPFVSAALGASRADADTGVSPSVYARLLASWYVPGQNKSNRASRRES